MLSGYLLPNSKSSAVKKFFFLSVTLSEKELDLLLFMHTLEPLLELIVDTSVDKIRMDLF